MNKDLSLISSISTTFKRCCQDRWQISNKKGEKPLRKEGSKMKKCLVVLILLGLVIVPSSYAVNVSGDQISALGIIGAQKAAEVDQNFTVPEENVFTDAYNVGNQPGAAGVEAGYATAINNLAAAITTATASIAGIEQIPAPDTPEFAQLLQQLMSNTDVKLAVNDVIMSGLYVAEQATGKRFAGNPDVLLTDQTRQAVISDAL